MSSPMRWFRRHQKVMMVFFGVGLMAIFGLGGVVTMMNPADVVRVRDNPVIATWKGGNIQKNDLLAMRQKHFSAIRFINRLQEYAAEKKGDNFRPMAAPIQPVAQGDNFDPELVDELLIERFLLAKRAEEEGLVVSDGMVEDYLALLAGNEPISRNEMIAINKQANQTASIENVFRRLKVEMAAEQMRQFKFAALPFYPNPTEAVEHYARTTRRVGCEVLPISVDVSTITEEPSAAEIKRIYDEGKFRFSDPVSGEPGFRVGKKVKIQYLMADLDTFLTNEMNEITDKMVQEEYDRLVEVGDPMVMEIVPKQDPVPPIAERKEDSPADTEKKGDDAAPAPNQGGEAGPANDAEKKGEENQPGGENKDSNSDGQKSDGQQGNGDPEESNGDAGQSGDDTNSNGSGSGENKEDSNSGGNGDGNEQALARLRNSTLVSLTQEQEKKEKSTGENQQQGEEKKQESTGQPATESPQTGDAKTAESVSDATQGPQENSESKADAKPQQNPPTGADMRPESKADTQDSIPEMADDEEAPERRPRPLADVADQIRRSMARKPANDTIKEAMRKAEAILGEYRYRYSKWEFAQDNDDKDVPQPEPFDGTAVIEELKNTEPKGKYVLEFGETGLVDVEELQNEAIGGILVPQLVMDQGRPRQTLAPLSRVIFNKYHDASLFDPSQENDFTSGATYQYWISEKQDSYVPDIEEAKPAIVKYWKTQRAVEKAKEQANAIAGQINQEGVQLTKSSHAEKAVSTGEFSWFNTMMGNPTISQPVGVVNAGSEFMEVVFGLELNEAGIAANESRDTVYVVQLVSEPRSIEVVGNEYLEDQFFKFKQVPQDVQSVTGYFVREIDYDWNKQFTDSMGLEFVDK